MNVRIVAFVLAAGFLAGVSCEPDGPAMCRDDGNLTIFERRIAPLLEDGNQSACNECHLAGVNLGLYSKSGDECTTMACMAELGLVDLDAPDESVVLDWILRGVPQSELVTSDVIQQEHDGVLEWIRFHAECGQDLCGDIEDPCGAGPTGGECEKPPYGHDEPARGFDDPGDCSDHTLEAGFAALVYSWRGRCFPCHFDNALGDENAPHWISEGACDIGSLTSMRNVLELGLVDVEHPEQSLLLLKPLAQSLGGLPHEGGDKFETVDDGAYQDFVAWLELYARCR
ncbi:MAG TPA: hypothetical protein VG755_27825 [Nannocystaceae bacterium]|nr:hypothetical protein [Nannocystaceae bacterium]